MHCQTAPPSLYAVSLSFSRPLSYVVVLQVNESNWSVLEYLKAETDNCDKDIDARIPAQLLVDYFSQLSEPLINLERKSLVWTYDSSIQTDVDESSSLPPLPALEPQNVGVYHDNSKWSVKEVSFVDELAKMEKKAYYSRLRAAKRKGDDANTRESANDDDGDDDETAYSMNPEEALKMFATFVTCPHARSTIHSVLRVLAKCKHATPIGIWKRACIRVGICLTHFEKIVAKSNIRGEGVMLGRNLIDFGDEDFYETLRTREIPVVESSSEIKLACARDVSYHAVLIGRFVSSLTKIFLVPSGNNKDRYVTDYDDRLYKRVCNFMGYFDAQRGKKVVVDGYTGYWGEKFYKGGNGSTFSKYERYAESYEDHLEGINLKKAVLNVGGGGKGGGNGQAKKSADKNKAKEEKRVQEMLGQVSGEYTAENIENMQRVIGGCENLYKLHMVGVDRNRKDNEKRSNDVTIRARYLQGLKNGRSAWEDLRKVHQIDEEV